MTRTGVLCVQPACFYRLLLCYCIIMGCHTCFKEGDIYRRFRLQPELSLRSALRRLIGWAPWHVDTRGCGSKGRSEPEAPNDLLNGESISVGTRLS